MGNNGHVLLKSGGLHHIKRSARPKSRRVTFVDCDHNDRWCTKKVDDGLVLRGSQVLNHMFMSWLGHQEWCHMLMEGDLGLRGRLL